MLPAITRLETNRINKILDEIISPGNMTITREFYTIGKQRNK